MSGQLEPNWLVSFSRNGWSTSPKYAPEHRVYGRDREIRRFLVHVVDMDGLQWKRLIGFRNVLLKNPGVAVEYEVLKLKAAAKFPTGARSRYTDEKGEFIAAVLGRHSE